MAGNDGRPLDDANVIPALAGMTAFMKAATTMLQHADQIEQHDVEPVNKPENRSLYKSRVKIHPKRVWGRFRQLKWWIMALTLGVYYITPWIRWDRGLGAPDQAVLIDIPGRRFYFFFIEIWPQEVYYFAGMLIMAAVGLFFVTSVVGRAWCGYTCPQTVWTDLFVWVERLVEGDRAARIRLDNAPMSVGKAAKRLSKYAIWLVISVATGGAWIFYFADAPHLAWDFIHFDADPVAYITVGVLTFTTFSLGGLMREQVCTYMCPWPRIQAAMMDEHSLTVTYKADRGEPGPRTVRVRVSRTAAIASIAKPVSSLARWGSISATVSNWNASPAPYVSTPATTSCRKSGGLAA